MSVSENNKRIAKNTLALYFRMFVTMIVSLYTSRVVLNTLGHTDFGIYGVVGGLVIMFSFLNSSMSGATSRFLSYDIGIGDKVRLRDTFSSAFWLHASIAAVIVVIAETAGLWFFFHKLVIPSERLVAAFWVYQLSILSMVVGVLQVPYAALLISYERMDVYAYVEIANIGMKLAVVLLLGCFAFDKLILYASLICIVGVLSFIFYVSYGMCYFRESHVRWVLRRDIMRPMLSFSGWDLYGNMSVMARTQGVNILLNMFFGPLMNAAATVATQVQGAVMSFAANVLMAVRPQIIKLYAQNEYAAMVSLIRNGVKVNFLLLLVISTPIIGEMDFVLHVWLGSVPSYAVIFCIYTLLFNFFASMSTVIVSGIHATGCIKRPSIINGSLYLLVIPLSYLAFRFHGPAWTSYFFNVVAVFLGMLSNAYTLHLYVRDFSLRRFLTIDLARCLLILTFALVCLWVLHLLLDEGWLRFFVSSLVSTSVLSFSGFYILLSSSLRHKIIISVKNKLCKKG